MFRLTRLPFGGTAPIPEERALPLSPTPPFGAHPGKSAPGRRRLQKRGDEPAYPMFIFLIFFIRRFRAAAFFFLRITLGFS